jgi:hypothetical protein
MLWAILLPTGNILGKVDYKSKLRQQYQTYLTVSCLWVTSGRLKDLSLRCKINTDRQFLNLTKSCYFDITIIHCILSHVPGGRVSILGGHIIDYSKQKKKKNFTSICTYVLFRKVSEIELFNSTAAWIWRPILSFPPAIMCHGLKHVSRCEEYDGRCDCW